MQRCDELDIATWNVNSLRVRLPQVTDWLAHHRPEILALQETKVTDAQFPRQAIESAGYYAVFSGQKTYNGVALLTRDPPGDVVTDIPGRDDPERRIIAATVNGIRVVNLYVINGSEVGSQRYADKLEWLRRVRDYLEAEGREHERLVVLGDFNIAPEDRDVHDPRAWCGRILCSPAERAALSSIRETGLVDVFRLFDQPPGSFSWWDYRSGAFRRNAGLRIDLILVSPALSRLCRGCRIDLAPRRLERPSDHAPVLAEFGKSE